MVASAAKYGELSYEEKDDGTIEITGCSRDAISVEIPDKIDGKPVTSIDHYAFSYHSILESIKIPDSVTSIGEDAFYGCESLESINIPESVTSIGDYAFNLCKSLKSVIIPDGVTNISDYAFCRCDNLESIVIPETVKSIGVDAFSYTKWLENKKAENPLVIINNILIDGTTCEGDVVIPDGVTEIVGFAFDSCENIESIVIPDGVKSVGIAAFENCINLKSVNIPDGVTEIGECAFNHCESLESIVIPESVTRIDTATFQSCQNIKSISIPDSVTEIGEFAFNNCESLESIKIPVGVTIINYMTFSYCSSLESIEIPNSITHIEESAFNRCEKLTDVYYSGTEEDWAKIEISEGNEELKNATIHYNYVAESGGTDVLYGDANGDGKINMADATLIVQHVGNKDKYKLTEEGAINADCDGKQGITGTDALAVQRYVAGIIKSLPEKV